MSLGPIELLFVKFPGDRFTGEINSALTELAETGTIRIIDIMFVTKDGEGRVDIKEINDLDDDDYAVYDPVVSDVTGLLSEDDIQLLSGNLENGEAAGLMVFENVWATRFADAVRNAGGSVVLNERIPRAIVEQAMAAQAGATG
jgi:hypothetical protein